MIPSWVPAWAVKAIPYLLIAGAIALAVWGYNHNIDKAYSEGHNAGVSYQKGVETQNTLRAREDNENEKKRIEREAQTRVDSASADRAFAQSTADRLQQELNRIRAIGQQYTGPQSSGTSTSTIINLLADMLESSNGAYRRTAAEADDYYNAGLTCQLQYESLISEQRRLANETSAKIESTSGN